MSNLTYEQLEHRNNCYVEELNRLQEELNYVKSKQFRRFSDEDCWIFDEDDIEGNHLESLVCPVVLRAKYLEGILLKAARYDWIKENVKEEVHQRPDQYLAFKTKYVLPYLGAYADFTGSISFDRAVDIKREV